MQITLKDYIKNYLMDDVSYAILTIKREGKNTINGVVVRVYDAALNRTYERRLKISSSELIYKVIDREEFPNLGDIDLIPWKYYDNHPSNTQEISDEEALDLIRRTLKAKYRIETIDKSRLAILENKED